jgi:DNA-binding CsgD family transcriptional regulator
MALARQELIEHGRGEEGRTVTQVLHLGTTGEVIDAIAPMIAPLLVNVGAGTGERVDLWVLAGDRDAPPRIAVLPCDPSRCGVGGPRRLNITVTPLTPCETRVMSCLPTHMTVPEMAEQLSLSRFTVKSHMASIYRKLEVTSRGAAVHAAQDLGILGSVSRRDRNVASQYRRRAPVIPMAGR